MPKLVKFTNFIKIHIIKCVLKLLENKFTSEEEYKNILLPKKNGELNTPINYSDYINKIKSNKIYVNPIQISPDVCSLFDILCDMLKQKLDDNQDIITNRDIIHQLLNADDLLIKRLYIADTYTNTSYNLDNYDISTLEMFLSSTKIIKSGHTQMAVLFNKFINMICRFIVSEITSTHKVVKLNLNKFKLIIGIAEEFFFDHNITLLIDDIIKRVHIEKAEMAQMKENIKAEKLANAEGRPKADKIPRYTIDAADEDEDAADAADEDDEDDEDEDAAYDGAGDAYDGDDAYDADDANDENSVASTIKNGDNSDNEFLLDDIDLKELNLNDDEI